MEFGAGLQNIGLNIWGPQNISSIFGGQQGNAGMDPPVLKVREYPLGRYCKIAESMTNHHDTRCKLMGPWTTNLSTIVTLMMTFIWHRGILWF